METTNDRAGAIDALVNYWISTLRVEDSADKRSVPAYCLETSASEALFQYLNGQTLSTGVAFDLGLELAAIVVRNPFDAATDVRAIIAAAVEDCREMDADEKAMTESWREK